ncbi:hypothetical protein AAVH_39375 [Aphelenchoides avenae]|nr:hypothetical protein AAVH_39375 [Aphelenchus avenae]
MFVLSADTLACTTSMPELYFETFVEGCCHSPGRCTASEPAIATNDWHRGRSPLQHSSLRSLAKYRADQTTQTDDFVTNATDMTDTCCRFYCRELALSLWSMSEDFERDATSRQPKWLSSFYHLFAFIF